MDTIRIGVVDDHEIVRVGLRLTLDAEPDMRVSGEAATPDAAIALARDERPDVMLLDARLGDVGMDGPAVCRAVLEASPNTAVVIMVNHRQDAAVAPSLVAGARGCLSKDVELR